MWKNGKESIAGLTKSSEYVTISMRFSVVKWSIANLVTNNSN